MSQSKKLYRIQEFADEIGVHAQTLRNWDKRGWLSPNHISPGGHRYYTYDQLRDYLQGKYKNKFTKGG